MDYEFLDHTADIKFRAYGKTLEEAFVNVARALTELIMGKQEIDTRKSFPIRVQANDLKSLLYDFIDHLLFLLDADQFIVGQINEMSIKNLGTVWRLEATLEGDKVTEYDVDTHVKAATYAEMEIIQNYGQVMIQAVVDL